MLSDIEKLLKMLPKGVRINSSARFVCEYKGASLHIQIQSDDRFYFKTDAKGRISRTWQYCSTFESLAAHIKNTVAVLDDEASKTQEDKENNEAYASSLSALLTAIADTTAPGAFVVGNTSIILTENNRFIITHASSAKQVRTTQPIKPATAVDRLVNLHPNKFSDARKLTKDRKLMKAITRSLKRREERMEAAAIATQMLDALATVKSAHPQGDRYTLRGTPSVSIVYNRDGKFLLRGEWMLPFPMLDKLGSLVPSVAKKLANPAIT